MGRSGGIPHGNRKEEEIVYCLDAKTGKEIGELPAGVVEKLGIGCATMQQGLYLDDVEIFYAK